MTHVVWAIAPTPSECLLWDLEQNGLQTLNIIKKSNASKMGNIALASCDAWHILTWYSDILGPLPKEGYPESLGEHSMHRWLGWPGQKGGSSLDVRRLIKEGYVWSLENHEQLRQCEHRMCSMIVITWKLVSSLWNFRTGVLNKNKEVPPNTMVHELKPFPQMETWEIPDPFVATMCLISARSTRLS